MAASGTFANNNTLIRMDRDGTDVESNGNRTLTSTSGSWGAPTTLAANTGKWYIEYYVNSGSSGRNVMVVPTNSAKYNEANYNFPATGDYGIILNSSGGVYNNNDSTASQTVASSLATGDIMGVAMNLDASPKTVQFYRNGTASGTAENINTSAKGPFAFMNMGHNQSTMTINAGQDSSFAGAKGTGTANAADGNGFGNFYYTPPSGFLALCSGNLPIDEDIDPAETDTNFPAKNHNTIVYTGTATAQSITGLGFKPDLVWIQNYGSQNQTPRVTDSSRGATKKLESSYANAEGTETGVTSFDSDGFTIGSTQGGYNTSTANYVAWCWRANEGTTATNTDGTITSTVQANTAAGFSIVTFTSPNDSSDQTVGHGLSATPDFIIAKNRDRSYNWDTFHSHNSDLTKSLRLNTNDGYQNGRWGTVNSTLITTKNSYTHYSTDKYVFYVWHDVEGSQKFGSYTGNGNSDGVFVYTGFRPKTVVVRRANAAAWNVFDRGRYPVNPSDAYINWDTDGGHTTGYPIDFLSNGFKARTTGTGINQNGTKFIFMAWGDVAFKYNNAL